MSAALCFGEPDEKQKHESECFDEMKASLRAHKEMGKETHATIKEMHAGSFWNTGLGVVFRIILEHGSPADLQVLVLYCRSIFSGHGS